MKTLGRIVVLVVVLALCLPSYGEILVYKFSQSETEFEQIGPEQWEIEQMRWKSYLVLDVDYDDNTITQAGIIDYGTEDGQKVYARELVDGLELVRVTTGAGVTWVVVRKDIEMDGGEVTGGDVSLLTGRAAARNVGSGTNREVASKIAGFSMWDGSEGGGRDMGISTISMTLYPAWTYWANGANGNQDFQATGDMIVEYLENKGYTEEVDDDD